MKSINNIKIKNISPFSDTLNFFIDNEYGVQYDAHLIIKDGRIITDDNTIVCNGLDFHIILENIDLPKKNLCLANYFLDRDELIILKKHIDKFLVLLETKEKKE